MKINVPAFLSAENSWPGVGEVPGAESLKKNDNVIRINRKVIFFQYNNFILEKKLQSGYGFPTTTKVGPCRFCCGKKTRSPLRLQDAYCPQARLHLWSCDIHDGLKSITNPVHCEVRFEKA